MKHAKHTPGPWSTNQALCPDRNEWVIEIQGEENFVADVKIIKTETSNANAHLIAAAPELLAFVEMLVRCAKYDLPALSEIELMKQAETILAKARGES